MDKDALSQLRDIHLPPKIGLFPLAPGWYLLMGLVLLGALIIAFLLYQAHKKRRGKQEALRLLKMYHEHYIREGNAQRTSANISLLLKRVALVYFPRQSVASLQGKSLIHFFNETSKGLDFNKVQHELLDLPYQPKAERDLSLLFKIAESWIKQRKKPCLK